MKVKILFVCLGNICRSPAAEGVMKALVSSAANDLSIEVDSAGIGGWHVGELPDSRMRRCGARRGYDFSSRARQVQPSDFDRFDYLFAMDSDNVRALKHIARSDADRRKIVCMADFFTTHRNSYHLVPDPYYGNEDDFDLALNLIEEGCEEILRQLIHKSGNLLMHKNED